MPRRQHEKGGVFLPHAVPLQGGVHQQHHLPHVRLQGGWKHQCVMSQAVNRLESISSIDDRQVCDVSLETLQLLTDRGQQSNTDYQLNNEP